MIEKLERDYGIDMAQAWGMTEILGGSTGLLRPGSAELPFERRIDRRLNSGRAIYGVKYRIVDDADNELPHDGVADDPAYCENAQQTDESHALLTLPHLSLRE